MIKPWLTLSTKIVHQTPWIEMKEDQCRAGSKELVYTYTRRRDQGPTIIAEESDGRLWLVRQYRHPIKKILWQFPAEGKSTDESWESAAQRGLNEELNLYAHELIHLGLTHPDPGGLEQETHYYLARGLEHRDFNYQPHQGEVEELERRAFSLAEIEKLIQKGEVCDNWTLAGLFLYHRFNSD